MEKIIDAVLDQLAENLPIIAIPILMRMIITLECVMRNKQLLENRVHPFTFNQYHVEEREQAAEGVSLYGIFE